MMKPKKRVVVTKSKDYGDEWINRLALILKTIEQMGPQERDASLEFIAQKYMTIQQRSR